MMAKDMKTDARKNTKNEALIALEDIHEKYRRLPSTDVETFAPVYYPIAILEMNLDEVTFEDFESVQFTILNIVSLGIKDYRVVAETLGLSSNYVLKIMRLLSGYGHLDDNGITRLGMESIHTGKKIVKSQVWQKFQVDALNGTLLKVEQAVTDNMLNEKDETRITIGHLSYLDGVPVSSIISSLTDNKCNSYIKQKSGILNTNVTSINDVRCEEIKYAKSYMMKVRNCDEPIIFAKRYNNSKKEVRERFSWEPFCVKNKALIDRYGFEENVPFTKVTARQYVDQLYKMMTERALKVNLAEEIKKAMDLVYPFHETGVHIARTDGVTVPTVNINEKAFLKYRSWIISYLIGIMQDGEYLITHERLYGHVISLRTESLLILDTAQLVTEKIDKHGKQAIVKYLRDKFKDFDRENSLIELIGNELKKMR